MESMKLMVLITTVFLSAGGMILGVYLYFSKGLKYLDQGKLQQEVMNFFDFSTSELCVIFGSLFLVALIGQRICYYNSRPIDI